MDALQLTQRELLRQELKAHGGVLQLVRQPLERISDDAIVIEGERGVAPCRHPFGFAGIGVFLVRLAIISQRSAPVSGTAAMIGAAGEALTAIEPAQVGQVRVRGEIWRARSTEPIAPGDRVRVFALEGLTVTVRKA